MPYAVQFSSSFKVLIIGGVDQGSEVIVFDMENNNYTRVTTTPSFPAHSTAIRIGNKGYIFDFNPNPNATYELDLEDYTIRILDYD